MRNLMLIFMLFTLSETALACKCNVEDTKARYEGADYVFRGVVSEVTTGASGKTKLKVLKEWKGQSGTGIAAIANSNSTCAVEFKKDKEYVLFLKISDSGLRATICDTLPAEKAAADLKWLDKNHPPRTAK